MSRTNHQANNMHPIEKNTCAILSSRPDDYPRAEHFSLSNCPLPALSEGQVRVKNRYLSIDPAMRGWVSDERNYLEPVAIGEVMRSLAVGEVAASRHPDYQVGEHVTGWFGWQQVANVEAAQIIRKIHEQNHIQAPPLSSSLGVLGLNGITAYLALNSIGRPQTGETLLVSTAAGAVGSIVGQLGKLAGCRVLGLTGSDKKVEQCTQLFGYDAALNYKNYANSHDLERAIVQLAGAPASGKGLGVDIFYDNTGGTIADAAFTSLNMHARVIQCGTASIGNWNPLPQGPRKERYFITKRLMQQGFVIFDHLEKWPATVDILSELIRSDQLHYSEEIYQGLALAPQALENLYSGDNKGKSLVEVEQQD